MIFLLPLVLLFSCAKNSTAYTYDWNKIADTSTTALISSYWSPSGMYFIDNNHGNTTFNYWPQAHALDLLADAYLRTQSSTYTAYMSQWYTGVQSKNGGTFLGQYYDDMGWNALAMLRAYDVTKDTSWKNAVETIWANIRTGWNDTMGGGIAWQKQQLYYKNTPANGPACILAARLYEHFGNASDLAWAQKIYNWWQSTLVDPGSGFVYDGINQNDNGHLNKTYRFTYNQGLFIGAAAEMYNATGQASYISNAIRTANNVLTDPTLSAEGILINEGQGDGGLFKGVLVRYMIQLILNKGIDTGDQQKFVVFLKNNAQTLWLKGTIRPGYFYNSDWTTPPSGETDLTTELSGAMLMEGMALMKKNNLF